MALLCEREDVPLGIASDVDPAASTRSSQSWNPQPRRAASAVREQASGRAAAATDECPGQGALALELPAAQDAVDAWGQPRRHERPAAPAKAHAHRGGVDEGADC